MTFYEVPAGQPQPVRAWFYPGDLYGQEFVYPKDRSLTVAQANSNTETQSPVTNSETVEPSEPRPEVAQNTPAPEPAPVAETPAPAPVQETPEVAANEPPPAPSDINPAPVMPQTASNIPLIAFFGLISIGAALGLSTLV